MACIAPALAQFIPLCSNSKTKASTRRSNRAAENFLNRSEGRRVYHLTDAGKEELKRSADSVKRIWERAATRAAENPDRMSKIREILDRTRKEIEDLDKR